MRDPREEQWRRAVEEFSSWEYWIQTITSEGGVSDDAKQAALNGLTDIQQVLGRGWWRDAVRTGHPLLALLLNGAPWTRHRIGEFGERLRDLQSIVGFEGLARRLKHARECAGAVAELDIAYRVIKAGFEINLSPAVDGHQPDIFVHSIPPVYIEITTLRTPDEWERGERTLDGLFIAAIADPDVVAGGAIHQLLSEDLIVEYQLQIRDAVQRVKETGKPLELHVPGVMDFYFTPSADEGLVALWNAEGKVQHFMGPHLGSSLVLRVTRAIGHKAAQLPKDSPGIVVIYDNLARLEEQLEVIAQLVQKAISRHGQVAAAVLITRTFSLQTQETTADVRSFGLEVSRPAGQLWREDALIMKNPTARHPLDVSLLCKLFSTS